MSFAKNYPNRKDKRKEYTKSKSFDKTCRNHGSCPWCKENRTHKNKPISKAQLKKLLNNHD